jgi:hypothetical protein
MAVSGIATGAEIAGASKSVVWAILRALSRAIRRDLGTFGSIKVNNFFLFVALLMYGALNTGLAPKSAYPFLLLLGLLLLFPLSSDPLGRIPPDRLALWPLNPAQRLALRLVSLALSPILWLTLFLLLKAAPQLALFFLGVAVGTQVLIVLGNRLASRAPRSNPVRHIPRLPGPIVGPYAELIRNNVRQILSVLDPYLAALLSLAGSAYRFLSPSPDAGAYPILAMLVALALSTFAQGLFSLDGAVGMTRYRLLPLRGWQILLAKDAALLGILLILVLPLSPLPGLTFGLAALAIGHFPSVLLRLPQRRWRFTGGRVLFGAAQILIGFTLGYAEDHAGILYLTAAAAAWLCSTAWCGRCWDRALTDG